MNMTNDSINQVPDHIVGKVGNGQGMSQFELMKKLYLEYSDENIVFIDPASESVESEYSHGHDVHVENKREETK